MRLLKRLKGLRANQKGAVLAVAAAEMPLFDLGGVGGVIRASIDPFLRRMVLDSRGTGAIEFAFIAPVLGLVAIGISDLSFGLARKYELEQASYRALERISAGSNEGGYAYVRPEAAAAAQVPEANVAVVTKLECGGVERPFSDTCTGTQETARFITVTIIDDYRPTFAYSPLTRSANGTIRLTARSTIRVQ